MSAKFQPKLKCHRRNEIYVFSVLYLVLWCLEAAELRCGVNV